MSSKNKKMRALPAALDELIEQSWIDEVVSVVKSGKEATVYCCRAESCLGREYVAAKYYRPRERRGFKNDAVYQEGRVIVSSRMRRAVEKKTAFGREVQQALWTGAEHATLQILHGVGGCVPEPVASVGDVLLMEYVGDGPLPGRPLHTVAMDLAEARAARELLIGQIALWLRHDRIHGDLSPYNILHTRRRGLVVIDFPQAVDPRESPHAATLLERDLANVADFLTGYGAGFDASREARAMWSAWKLGRL